MTINDENEDSCCSCSQTFERRFMLTLVFSLIGFDYISFYIVAIWPWRWWETLFGFFNIIFFNIVVFLLMVSYVKTIFINPGHVPPNYVGLNLENLEKH